MLGYQVSVTIVDGVLYSYGGAPLFTEYGGFLVTICQDTVSGNCIDTIYQAAQTNYFYLGSAVATAEGYPYVALGGQFSIDRIVGVSDSAVISFLQCNETTSCTEYAWTNFTTPQSTVNVSLALTTDFLALGLSVYQIVYVYDCDLSIGYCDLQSAPVTIVSSFGAQFGFDVSAVSYYDQNVLAVSSPGDGMLISLCAGVLSVCGCTKQASTFTCAALPARAISTRMSTPPLPVTAPTLEWRSPSTTTSRTLSSAALTTTRTLERLLPMSAAFITRTFSVPLPVRRINCCRVVLIIPLEQLPLRRPQPHIPNPQRLPQLSLPPTRTPTRPLCRSPSRPLRRTPSRPLLPSPHPPLPRPPPLPRLQPACRLCTLCPTAARSPFPHLSSSPSTTSRYRDGIGEQLPNYMKCFFPVLLPHRREQPAAWRVAC